jgi:gliding motility-associated-like protein
MLFNNYQGYIGGSNRYIIERSIDDIAFTSINSIYSDSSMIHNDKIDNLESFEGKVCYKIKCIENTNIYNTTSESYSNQICFYFDPKIFIPNAFTPNGINPIFKPIISIADIENYELTIINRWGQAVFNTKKIEDGWNGQMGNQDAPNGLYIYQIQINTGFKKEIIKRGLINLIR